LRESIRALREDLENQKDLTASLNRVDRYNSQLFDIYQRKFDRYDEELDKLFEAQKYNAKVFSVQEAHLAILDEHMLKGLTDGNEKMDR
jgi:hypothetical protein